MIPSVIALFGEAKEGKLDVPYFCKDLLQLFTNLGQPPEETYGLYFAVQTLLYGWPIIYFRVREEGGSFQDYRYGLRFLRSYPIIQMKALFLPGVGSKALIEEGSDLCRERKSLLIIRAADLYDYLTDSNK
ncbi:MAG: hypothetical protein JSR46_01730 [Verrucomicrobia bacterium]|nr:hypothetical protein [Verrucomicrobiota bacterium]